MEERFRISQIERALLNRDKEIIELKEENNQLKAINAGLNYCLQDLNNSEREIDKSYQWIIICKNLAEGDVLEAINNYGDLIRSIAYQGERLAIRFFRKIDFSELKKIFPSAHIEKMPFEFKKISNYVFK